MTCDQSADWKILFHLLFFVYVFSLIFLFCFSFMFYFINSLFIKRKNLSYKNRYTELSVLHLQPLAHHQNEANLSFLNRHYFVCWSTGLAQVVPHPYCWGKSIPYSDRLHDFFGTIPGCYKDFYVNIFFTWKARLWNSLSGECFPFTYYLNGFKSRINKHLLTVGSF